MSNKKTTYTLEIDAEVKSLENKLTSVKNLLSGVLNSAQAPKGLEKGFEKLDVLMDRIRSKAAQPIDSKAGFSSINKDIDSANVTLTSLLRTVEKIGSMSESAQISFLPPEAQKEINAIISAMDKFDQAIVSAATETKELVAERSKLADIERRLAEAKADQQFKESGFEQAKTEKKNAEDAIAAIQERKQALEQYRAELEKVEKFYSTPNEDGTKKNRSKKYEGVSARPQDIKKKISSLEESSKGDAEALEKQTEAYKRAKASQESYLKTTETAKRSVAELTRAQEEASKKVEALSSGLETTKIENQQKAYDDLRTSAIKVGISLDGIGESYSEADSAELISRFQELKQKGLDQIPKAAKKACNELSQSKKVLKETKQEVETATDAYEEMSDAMSKQQAFEQRVKSLLGVAGATQLISRAARDAMSTIKELDATMTEMAVVTDLSVGDYWDQLPEYSRRATQLGVSVNSAYKAATLYYQQGLKTNEVNAISVETLKMAKIAGLDAKDATDKMTAALRGFNMELTEASAQNVADVYSELAAITAADVNEISSAMSKTASIAHSAGMEFETTAAFLSQIIETTRESAETAGTALKTVIARFQELKKDPSEIGEVDGEVVDANKIETALRSVGVSLRDANGQFRDLDDVFMELSSKWNTLDTNTQRYIATIAAGSRQQSRFIAMMQDYGRTQQLVSAANNSAGASNKQFEKTMDSLEAKLAKLENAWNEFSMGIMNSEVVKLGVDILTKFLEVINKSTSGLEGLGGSITKILTIVATFKFGKTIFEKLKPEIMTFFTGLTTQAGNAGERMGQAAKEGFKRGSAGGTDEGPGEGPEKKKKFDLGFDAIKEIREKKENARNKITELGSKEQIEGRLKASNQKMGLAKGRITQAENRLQDSKLLKDTAKSRLAEIEVKGGTKGSQAWADADKALKKANQQVKQHSKNLETQKQHLQKVAEEQEKINQDMADYDEAVKTMGEAGQQEWAAIGNAIGSVGSAITGVGIGVSALGGVLSSLGLEELGEGFSSVGNVITLLGGALMGVAQIMPLLGNVFTIEGGKIAIAGTTAQLAWWWVLLIVVAVVALIALTAAAISAIQKASPEGKLKAAEAAAEAAGDAANYAADAYDNLVEALDGLKGKYAVLDDLTEGTEEWNKAVNDINSSVMELIEQYPELAGLVENEGGVLKLDLDSKEVKGVISEYKKTAVKAKGAELQAKANVEKAQSNLATSKLSDNAKVGLEKANRAGLETAANTVAAGAATGATIGGAGGALGGSAFGPLGSLLVGSFGAALGAKSGALTGAVVAAFTGPAARAAALENAQAETDALAQALAKGEISSSEEDITQYLVEEFGYAADEAEEMAKRLSENADELKDYGKELESNSAAMDAYYDAMAMQAQSLIDLGQYNSKQVAQMTAVVDGDALEGYVDDLKSDYSDMGKEELQAEKEAYAKEVYGQDAKVDGNKITYKDEEGKEQTRELTKEEWIETLSGAGATEKAAKAMEEVPGMLLNSAATLEKAQEGAGKAFTQALATSGQGLTKAQSELLESMDPSALQDAWDSLSEEQQEIYQGDYLKYVEALRGALDNSEKAFRKAENAANDLGITLHGNLSAEAAQAWTSHLQTLAYGGEDVSGMNAALGQVLNGLTAEQSESFMAQLNAVDFSDVDSWKNFQEVVQELNLPVSNFEEFVEVAIETSNAIKKVDFTTLNESLQSTYSLIEKINESSSRSFSEEDYKALIATNSELKDVFRQVGDQYVYVGGDISNLTAALDENTEATIAAANDQLAFLVAAGEIIGKDENLAGDVASMDRDQLTTYLDSMADQMVAGGLDLSKFGIAGLTNATDFSKIEDTDLLREIATTFQTTGANVEYNKAEQAKNLENANISTYINKNSAMQNANFAAQGGSQAKAHSEALITQAALSGGVSDALIAQYRDAIDKANAEGATDADKAEAAELGKILAERTEEALKENNNKDSYMDLVDRVAEAIYNSRQEEIDKLGEVNDSINDAQSALVDKIQQQIDSNRQQRENEKAEKNIQDLQQRRAYLMADSSGANALELMDLDQQIAEAEQEYQDTLVDQALQKLQDANDQAADQREKQIELLQAQLDADQDSGLIANQAAEIAKTSIEDIQNGVAPLETAMGQLLWGNEGKGLGKLQQEEWVSQLNQTAALAEKYLVAEEEKNSSPGVTHTEEPVVEGSGGERPEDVVPELTPDAAPALSAWEQFKLAFADFFTQDIPNWWNTYIAPFFTAEFWQQQWSNITEWWDTNVAPVFTGEFWSQKFTEAGVAVGQFIKSIIDSIAAFGVKIQELIDEVNDWFLQIGINIAEWWNQNLAKYFTKEFWTEQWNNIVAGAKDMWNAFVSFFTNTIPKWWNEKIAPMFTKEYWKEKWDSFVQGLAAMWEKVQNFFKEKILPIFTKEYWVNLVAKIGEGIKTGFEAAINAVIRGLNSALKGLADIYNNSIGSFIAGVASVFGGKDVGKITYKEIGYVKFKEGGLANFTGPAWLDGTKTKPEMVLNARDTENFIALKDILSDVLKGDRITNNNNQQETGGNHFDIEINVEKLSEDYDVERLADKIRRMIYEDASYRNVNAVGLIR